MDALEPNEVEHTFESGRTMVIRRSLPMQVLLYKTVEDGDMEVAEGLTALFNASRGEGADEDDVEVSLHVAGRMTRAVVEAMFIRPRVRWHEHDVNREAGEIGVEDLHDSEIAEALELATKAVEESSRFRRNGASPEPGDDGEDVVKKPKRAAGAKARKR